jgi:ribosome biogenesis protein SSF1/2
MSSKARAAAAAAQGEGDDDGGKDDNVERRAVKLVELGPRMRLRLTKVEEGLCSGKIMWHQYLHKTKEEKIQLEKKWEQRRKDKEARKKQQKENVEKKKAAKAGNKKPSNNGDDDEMDVDDYSDLYSDDGFDSEGLEGDAEEHVNAQMEDNGEWEDEKEEIADSKKPKKRALKG